VDPFQTAAPWIAGAAAPKDDIVYKSIYSEHCTDIIPTDQSINLIWCKMGRCIGRYNIGIMLPVDDYMNTLGYPRCEKRT